MSSGCIRQIFVIQNGRYYPHEPLKSPLSPTNSAHTEIRVTYEGCDYLCLPPSQMLPDFFDGSIVKIPSISNQTLLRCEINGKPRLFYINKAEHTVLEIHGVHADEVERLVCEEKNEKPVYYQPESIPFNQIETIAHLIKHPLLFIRAKRAKNIELKLTTEQRRLALMMLDDNNINFRNTSYTYAFQAYLAKYMYESMHEKVELQIEIDHQRHTVHAQKSSLWRFIWHALKRAWSPSPEEKLQKIEAMQLWATQLHQLSARFRTFDTFINNRGANPKTTLKELKDAFLQYQKEIDADLDGIIQTILDDDVKCIQKRRILRHLKDQLRMGMNHFNNQLTRLEENPTKEQIDRLVSITDRDLFIRSLGGFMQEQMTAILRAGIQVTYKISNQRLSDVIQVPRLVAQLSDAKHLMLLKGQSIVEGPKDNDTYSRIPEAMLAATTDAEIEYQALSRFKSTEIQTIKRNIGSEFPKINTIDVSKEDYKKLSFTLKDIKKIQQLLNEYEETKDLGEKLVSTSEAKWFSIKPYLKQWNPALVDKILCIITGHAATRNNHHGNWFYHGVVQPLKLFASVFEIAFSVPRLGLVLSLGLAETLFSIITWQHKSTELKLTYRLNQWITQFYQDYAFIFAPLTYLKHSPWNVYQRQDQSHQAHQHVLDACTDYSGFCYSLFIYFTPHLISETILDFFSTIFRQIMNTPRDLSYLISDHQQAEEIFQQVKFRHHTVQNLNDLLKKRLSQAKKPRLIRLTDDPQERSIEDLRILLDHHIGYIKYKHQIFYFDNKTLREEYFASPIFPENGIQSDKASPKKALSKQFHSLMSRLKKNVLSIPTDEEMALINALTGHIDLKPDHYEPLSYCTINHISSPLDVFYDIMVTLSNGVVNPMFRKSPGVATFFFAISISTLGTFLLPAPALAWLKSIPAWLKYPAEQISLHFTGKSTALGIQEQVVACFLEWKLGFFATEFCVEMAHGHFEILEPLFEEPEQIVLGLVGLISLGIALQYVPELPTTIHLPGLPEIPNYYFMIINLFTEEAKECAHGTIGPTSIEYGFLGLKFAMLMHSMLSGSESREAPTPLQKLVLSCGQKSFFKDLIKKFQAKELHQWLKDRTFTEELTEALSRTDKTIFDPPASQNPKIQEIATILTNVVNHTLASQKLNFETHEINLFKTALAKQILKMPEFLTLSATKKKVQEVSVARKPKPKSILTHKNLEPLTVTEAYQSLCEAINLTQDPENPLVFSSHAFGLIKEAYQYYDYLDDCFEAYNQAVKREYGTSHPDYETLYLDKRAYLDIFFNNYCYQPSNNLIRSFIFFTYPLTVVWRSSKFIWATVTHKPCMQHQIVKNFCKDMVLLSQVIGPLARMTSDFNLYMTGTIRGLAFLATSPIILTVYPAFFFFAKIGNRLRQIQTPVTPFSTWFESLDDWICYLIAFHRTPELHAIRQLFVRTSRIAGMNKDIVQASEKMNRDLDEIAIHIGLSREKAGRNSIELLQTLLPEKNIMHDATWSEDSLSKLLRVHENVEPEISSQDSFISTPTPTDSQPSPRHQNLSV